MRKALLVISIVILICLSVAGYFYFVPNNKVVAAFDEQGLNLVIEGDVILSKDQPKIVDDEIMLPIDIVKKYFDPNIYWDDALKKVTVTTKDKVIRMKTDSLNALINNKPVTLKIPVTVDSNTVYIPIGFLSDLYNIETTYLKDSNVIVIDHKNSARQVADTISKDAVVRSGHSIHYPIVQKLQSSSEKPEDTNNTLRVFGDYEKWYKVRTQTGAIGYIEKRFVAVKDMPVKEVPKEETDSTWKPNKGKINLVWDQISNQVPAATKAAKIEGLDVISPTWFQVADESGTLINRAYPKYVEWAHKNGYKVWALLANDFDSPDMTRKLLNNTDARDNVIRQVLVFASLYKLDGINIDFENISKEDKGALTQFVREMTPLLKEQGLVVSIDVTVPDGSDNWSLCYDRKALGDVVDYVMLMAYDQYWATSPVAGSVAQVSWVEKNLQKTLEMVPAQKLMLGMPFYTRLWKEEAGVNGKTKISSPQTLSMAGAQKMIKENNAQVKWDDVSGQFYAEFKKDGSTFKIWLEDGNSINLKAALVQKYKLAGAAEWKKGSEVSSVWDVLNNDLKSIDTYQQWAVENKGKAYAYSEK